MGFGWQMSQEVCPWNHKFAREVQEPSFQPRAVIAGKDAKTLAGELLAMSEDELRVAFKRLGDEAGEGRRPQAERDARRRRGPAATGEIRHPILSGSGHTRRSSRQFNYSSRSTAAGCATRHSALDSTTGRPSVAACIP